MGKKISRSFALIICFCMISYSESVPVETLLNKVDEGFIQTVQKEKEDRIVNAANLPGKKIIEKVKDQIRQRMAAQNFPCVEKGSKTERNLVELFQAALSKSGIAKGEFQLQTILKNHPDVFSYLPEIILEDFVLDIQTAQIWERMNPSEDEVPVILRQLKEIKEKTKENLLSVFGKEYEKEVQDILDSHFIQYEKGPTSLLSPWAKTILSRERMAFIDKRLNEIKKKAGRDFTRRVSIPDETAKKGRKREVFFHSKIEPQLRQYSQPVFKVIRDEYLLLIPSEIRNLKLPQRIIKLRSAYIKDIEKFQRF